MQEQNYIVRSRRIGGRSVPIGGHLKFCARVGTTERIKDDTFGNKLHSQVDEQDKMSGHTI